MLALLLFTHRLLCEQKGPLLFTHVYLCFWFSPSFWGAGPGPRVRKAASKQNLFRTNPRKAIFIGSFSKDFSRHGLKVKTRTEFDLLWSLERVAQNMIKSGIDRQTMKLPARSAEGNFEMGSWKTARATRRRKPSKLNWKICPREAPNTILKLESWKKLPARSAEGHFETWHWTNCPREAPNKIFKLEVGKTASAKCRMKFWNLKWEKLPAGSAE